jgi:hypothetical protein
MSRLDSTLLRFELLRARAAIERAEVRAAMLELRSATRPLYRLVGTAFNAARRMEGHGGSGAASVAGTAFGLLRDRPWLVSAVTALAARRGVRRWLLLGALAALAVWSARRIVRRAQAEAEAASNED